MKKHGLWFGFLPHPKSWLMALKLAFPAYFGATVVIAFEFWRYLLMGGIIASASLSPADSKLFFMIAGAALILSLIWFLLFTGISFLFLKLLWTNPPKSIMPHRLRTTIFRDFPILVLSMLPIIVIFAFYNLSITSIEVISERMKVPRLTYDQMLLKYFWLWLIMAAYLYQFLPSLKFQYISTDKNKNNSGSA